MAIQIQWDFIKRYAIYLIITFTSLIGAYALILTSIHTGKIPWTLFFILVGMGYFSFILQTMEEDKRKRARVQYTPTIKTGVCECCGKEGVIYFRLLHESHIPEVNDIIISINEIIVRNFSERVLLKIGEKRYACKECVEKYGIKANEIK